MKYKFTIQGATLKVETSSSSKDGVVVLQVATSSFKESFQIRPQSLKEDFEVCLQKLGKALGSGGSFRIPLLAFRVLVEGKHEVSLRVESLHSEETLFDYAPIRPQHVKEDLDAWLKELDEVLRAWKFGFRED